MEEFSLYNNRTPTSTAAPSDKEEENRRNNSGRVPSHIRRRSRSLPRVGKEGEPSGTHVTRARDDSALPSNSYHNTSGVDRRKDVSKITSELRMKHHQKENRACTNMSATNTETCTTGTPREHRSAGKTGKNGVSRVEELQGLGVPGHRPQSERLPRKSHGGERRGAAASGPSTPALGMYRSRSDGKTSQTLV